MGEWDQETLRRMAARMAMILPAGFGSFGYCMSYQEVMALGLDEFELLWDLRQDAIEDLRRASAKATAK